MHARWTRPARNRPRRSILAASNFLSAILALVFGPMASKAFGKRDAARLLKGASIIFATAPIILLLMGGFAANGEAALLPILVVASTLASAVRCSPDVGQAEPSGSVAEVSRRPERRPRYLRLPQGARWVTDLFLASEGRSLPPHAGRRRMQSRDREWLKKIGRPGGERT